MASIQEFMTQHHKTCDNLLVEAEAMLANKDWAAFAELWGKFEKETLHHFDLEEQILFPAFEEQTGMTAGPTMVMRHEHAQIKAMFEQMGLAIEKQDIERAMGSSESIMIFIQQHNMKEEQILYPMTDNHLSNSAEIVEQMSSH
ncbi:hemerythrin domain-containing protein [Vibrio kasasachensis]|uniref:hemerythrin domain-containing protein n=1 Tax=Vibrio kasasachensis TaxID=2910248 RepID=UPI003D0B3F59